jgi:hypothetical protein
MGKEIIKHGLFLMLVCLSCNTDKAEHENSAPVAKNMSTKNDTGECGLQRKLALKDYKNAKMKYYFSGISSPSKSFIQQFNSLGVRVIVNGCAPDKNLSCYNSTIDSILLARFKVDVSAIK